LFLTREEQLAVFHQVASLYKAVYETEVTRHV